MYPKNFVIWTFHWRIWGGAHVRNLSQFHEVFWKFWQNLMLAPRGGLAPPPTGNTGSAPVFIIHFCFSIIDNILLMNGRPISQLQEWLQAGFCRSRNLLGEAKKHEIYPLWPILQDQRAHGIFDPIVTIVKLCHTKHADFALLLWNHKFLQTCRTEHCLLNMFTVDDILKHHVIGSRFGAFSLFFKSGRHST